MNGKLKILVVGLLCLVMGFALSACGGEEKAPAEEPQPGVLYEIDPEATTLTIMGVASAEGEDIEKTYTAEDLEALGTETINYSGRNKKVEDARQFWDMTGVDLKTLLIDAGVSKDAVDDATLKVTCSDEYVMEYSVSDLYTDKYAYKDNETNDRVEVGAMIAIEEPEADSEFPSPFRIVFGQADYDSFDNSAQDYNTQGWGSYIQLIEVSFSK
ncbi:MAG: hypothetical protein ACOX4R_04090 [Lentihominibacter sp.]|jgi:hypothetical protein